MGESDVNSLPNNKFLDFSSLKEFLDDNFKSHKNVRNFSKSIENTLGQGEIARYEQFLLFPQCFQTLKNQGLFGKGLNCIFFISHSVTQPGIFR